MEGEPKLSNYQAWQLRMREVTSPQPFIDVAFYYLIAAALQRRVWTNADHQKLYPNIYPILVGEPGVGKGLVIKPVIELLKEHKLENTLATKDIKQMDVQQMTEAAIEAADFAQASTQTKVSTPRERLKIPVGANCITFEALVHEMATSVRRINFKRYDNKLQKQVQDIYSHNSLCFALEEISSLFHKDSMKVVNFLITAYDCGNYEYVTKTQSQDYIKRCCLNFFGGTTPKFIEDSFNDKILEEGFSSRTWFIYGAKSRFYRLRTPELDESQRAAQQQLSQHVLALTKLYGHLDLEEDAWNWLANWWENEQSKPDYVRPNNSEKLNAYYSRKNIHVLKLAVAIHCGEDASTKEDGHTPANKITLEEVQRAYKILSAWEVDMHMALSFAGINPYHKLSRKVLSYLKKHGPKTTDQLLLEFYADIPGQNPQEAFNQMLTYMSESRQIEVDPKTLRWFPKS